MGCWNATCNVSRLPIFCGDEIVVIPLIAVSATVTANTSYATDNFVPFSFPIVGKYNDYGGIEDAVITEENDKLIRSYEFYKSNGDGTAPYKVEIGDDMEKFISEELCGRDAYFIKTNNTITYPDGLALVSVFFVHKNLYDTLVHEMGERIPFNMSECQRDLLKKKFEYEVSLCRKNIEDMFNNISFTANPTSSSDAIVLFLANPSEWVKEYVEKMFKEQEWSLKHIRRQVSIDRYKEQKLVEYKKTPSKDLIQAKLFHDSVPKSGQVKVTLDIDGKQFVGSFDSKFFGYTGTNLDEAILPGAGFKYPDSFTGYYEFLRDNKINIDCKYNMFPFAFVKEIAAFRGDKIFWKKEA